MQETQIVDVRQQRTLQPVVPETPINIRPATMDDYDFIDALQKKHSKMVGFLHRASIKAYITQGGVLIAEGTKGHGDEGTKRGASDPCVPANLRPSVPVRLGYCISKDTYYKREDTGIIYQMNIVPEVQRGLIAATLLKETFARSPYGVKLYCCWCAQDLDANHFWEAMGFTPLAFRTGSPKKGKSGEPRMHIFWQKRIRAGDEGPASGGTPWWFPSETKNGAIGEGRLVIPIPIGAHWSDPMPVLLPGEPERLEVEGETSEGAAGEKPKHSRKAKKVAPQEPQSVSAIGGLRFGPTPEQIAAQKEAEKEAKKAAAKAKRAKKPKMRNNPKHVAAARELRDRFLEEVERQPELLEGQSTGGKYDVTRQIEAAPSAMMMDQGQASFPMLDAA